MSEVRQIPPGNPHRFSAGSSQTRFYAQAPPPAQCQFSYRGVVRQVPLGFMAAPEPFWSYDKGIDPQTGRTLWGAILGPYQFAKVADFSDGLPATTS